MVLDFLQQEQIHVTGNARGQAGEFTSEDVSEEERDEQFFNLYRHDLRSVKKYSSEELEELVKDHVANREILTSAFLRDVVRWIEPYRESGVYVCDLVQEGNLGLMEGMLSFSGGSLADLKKHLKQSVTEAVMAAVSTQEDQDNVAMKILGRVNGVNECAREMSQNLGRKVKIAELANKLNMTVEEIQEINELSGYKLENIDF
jgi:RNA polymerase primary sigma factor